jgi:ketose-bisphosphate aldolase
MIDEIHVPVVLHLDHGGTLNDVVEAIKVGFSSVMFDGSMLPYEENIQKTRQVVERAHNLGISVEAELGHVGSGDSNDSSEVEISEDHDESVMTDPTKAMQFVEETGVDALAVSIGTVHGYHKTGSPKIDFERLEKINAVVPVPLVLHGGSGVSPNDLRKSIQLGIRKINVWSDLIREIKNEMVIQLEEPQSGPGELGKAVKLAMDRVLRNQIELSGYHKAI